MDLKSKIESILLVVGEPVTIKRLEKLSGAGRKDIETALSALRTDYEGRGIRLINNNDEWQFGTAPEASSLVENIVKSEFSEALSRAALETLSVIAYKGPLMRAEVEHIRGVNSSFSIRNLLLRGLVERIDNPKDARSYLYRVSMDFLKYLGLESLEALPGWEEFRKVPLPEEKLAAEEIKKPEDTHA